MSQEIHRAVLRIKYPDISNYIIEDENGITDTKSSLKYFIDDLQQCINKLQTVHDLIPEENSLNICGNGERIGLQGDPELVKKLVYYGLATEWTYDDDEDLIYYDASDSESNNDDDHKDDNKDQDNDIIEYDCLEDSTSSSDSQNLNNLRDSKDSIS